MPILAVHDKIVVECDEGDAEEVEAWLKRAMVDGMDGVLNAPDAEGPHVPVETEVESGKTWAGGPQRPGRRPGDVSVDRGDGRRMRRRRRMWRTGFSGASA